MSGPRILQATSKLVFPTVFGKWSCGDSEGPVNRYLQHDGTWGKNTHWFDTREEVEELLKLGHKPDFTEGEMERHYRLMMEDDARRSFDEDDYFDDNRYSPRDDDYI